MFYSFPWKYSTFSNVLAHLLSHLPVGVLKSVAAVLTWDIDNPELWNKDLIAYGWTLPQSRERSDIKLYGFLPGWEAAPLSFNPSTLVSPFFLGKACKIPFMYVVIQFVPKLCASKKQKKKAALTPLYLLPATSFFSDIIRLDPHSSPELLTYPWHMFVE